MVEVSQVLDVVCGVSERGCRMALAVAYQEGEELDRPWGEFGPS